ncbi:Ribosome recycling factor [Olavius algarvensis spirochete endosymbiont]|uniref:ribosome recycling factor n=1 Tax=Olavius algarvensis spirochete endosymbiont TaxID=260710 RepID=UPI00052BDC89|nr:ribosome recycling factor [Olavius algarvensis spirochete endosymbiont]KGM42660.1 ribosome recycling factor [Alkalispirochaeta odontotermitis]VDB00378.1 Ribosome recycling factor [Olavius algarvensis spirochete endosymbiont]
MDDLRTKAEEKMKKSITSLEEELNFLRSGRASAALFDRLRVDYYGTPTPLKQLANISIPEARLIVIQPFDRNSIGDIEKAILASELGLNPGNDGKLIRISIPPLNEERRKELVKKVNALAENARVSIRNIRRDINEQIKSGNFTDDEQKKGTNTVQKLTDSFVEKIAAIVEAKKEEIMEI